MDVPFCILSAATPRNGLVVSIPLQQRIWGPAVSLDIYVTDTRIFSDALYGDNYQEIGISFGPMRWSQILRAMQWGSASKHTQGGGDIAGLEVSFGYRF